MDSRRPNVYPQRFFGLLLITLGCGESTPAAEADATPTTSTTGGTSTTATSSGTTAGNTAIGSSIGPTASSGGTELSSSGGSGGTGGSTGSGGADVTGTSATEMSAAVGGGTGTSMGGTAAGGSGTGTASTGTVDRVPSVLVFSRTTGYEHASIPAGTAALTTLASAAGWQLTATQDAGQFSDEGLEPFNVVVFLNTTDEVLDPDQESAFERFI